MTTITATRPSANIIKEQIIPPKEYLGMELRKGERLRIIDVEGKQVPDMVCFNLKDPAEKLSCNNSRLIQKRWKLTTGNVLYSDEGNEARVFGGGFIARSERGVEAEAMLSRLSVAGSAAA